MSEPENFLERWSKRKRAAVEPAAPEREELARPEENKSEPAAPAAAGEAAAAPSKDEPFDLTSLPSIESIGAQTDVTAFLRPGVPPDLTRAALRRAWSTDPAIRDFVGLVENGWDFNDPQAMAGFGPIGPAEVARLVAHMIGELPVTAAAVPAEASKNAALSGSEGQSAALALAAQPAAEKPDAVPESADVHRTLKNDAAQKNSDS